jgi:hypothetical protein
MTQNADYRLTDWHDDVSIVFSLLVVFVSWDVFDRGNGASRLEAPQNCPLIRQCKIFYPTRMSSLVANAIIQTRNIIKDYPQVGALDQVGFEVCSMP